MSRVIHVVLRGSLVSNYHPSGVSIIERRQGVRGVAKRLPEVATKLTDVPVARSEHILRVTKSRLVTLTTRSCGTDRYLAGRDKQEQRLDRDRLKLKQRYRFLKRLTNG